MLYKHGTAVLKSYKAYDTKGCEFLAFRPRAPSGWARTRSKIKEHYEVEHIIGWVIRTGVRLTHRNK